MKTGEQLRDEGMKKTLDATHERWKEEFTSVACSTLFNTGSVSAEEVVANMTGASNKPNAIGAMMRSFAKARGLIPTYEKSKHPAAHARVVARWSRP